MIRHSFFALSIALFGFNTNAFAQTDTLSVSGAWVREAPPTTKVLAGYMQLDNKGTKEIIITGASSPQFDTVEIHRTEIKAGVASMIAQDSIVIPAGGSVTLDPGDMHLMLIQSLKPLQRGDHVEIQLQLSTGDSLQVHAEVRAGMGDGMDHSHHHHHHH